MADAPAFHFYLQALPVAPDELARIPSFLRPGVSRKTIYKYCGTEDRPVAEALKWRDLRCQTQRCSRLGADQPQQLAGQLLLLIDGAITNALVSGRSGVAADARRVAETLLVAGGLKQQEINHVE